MVQYIQGRFDVSFAALSGTTRRGVLEQLARADASITDLAEKFHMTLMGMRAGCPIRSSNWTRFSSPWARASTVCEVCALSDLNNISVRIADVAARLAVFGDRFRDELRSSTFP